MALVMVLSAGLGGIALALGPAAASAQARGETTLADQFFRIDWSVKDNGNGHARLSG
jgi:hypothetical protein